MTLLVLDHPPRLPTHLRRLPPKWTHRPLTIIAALSLVWLCSACGEPDTASPPDSVDTSYGRLTSADRDLLIRLRLDGLWQVPAGREAQARAGEKVKAAARRILDERIEFDTRVRSVSAELGVFLPNQPNDQQMAILAKLTASPKQGYDRAFVGMVHDALVADLLAIAEVRASTHNTLIRPFADEANAMVASLIGYLYSTGLVEDERTPSAEPLSPSSPPAFTSGGASAVARPLLEGPYQDPRDGVYSAVIWLVLAVAVVAAVATAAHVIRPR